ncbi:DHA2 family efflux MFS transporter permease subunit [bacterium]|nr:MAG: DHA2 family efflux MFS transporter permease subunit [bacterium]
MTVMLGMIMAIIDSTIVNVALDAMAGNLGTSIDEISWVATAYILATVVVMPLNGFLTALLGRKMYYALSICVFTISSFLCGTAHSLGALIFYRVIQGIGGGALQPTAQAILFESYPAGRRGQAMAIFGIGAMFGPAIGPTLGGYIVDNFSWPLIFLINLPIGIVALMMTLAYVPDPHYIKRTGGEHLDWLGLAAMTAGLASLQYVLERGQHDDWFNSNTIVLLAATAVVGLAVFIWRQLTVEHPLVDLRVFRHRSFTAGNVLIVVTGFGLFGTALILPLFFQTLLRFDAFQTGLALMPGAIATAIAMPIAGRLTDKIDGRIPVLFGMLLFGLSTWWMGSLNQNAGYWDVFWPRVWQGFSLAFIFVPLSTLTMGAVGRAETANASGIYNLLRQLGGSLGIAVLTTILSRDQTASYQSLSTGVTLAHPSVRQAVDQMTQSLVAQGHTFFEAQRLALLELANTVLSNAMTIAYDDLFRLSAVVFFVAAPLIFLLKRPTHKPVSESAATAE